MTNGKENLKAMSFGQLLDTFEAAIRLNHYDPIGEMPDPGYKVYEVREELVNRCKNWFNK